MTKIRKMFVGVIAGAMALSLCGGVASAASSNTAVITLESTVIAWDGATEYTIPIAIRGSEDCHALSFGFTIADNMELEYDGYDTLARDGNNWWYGFSAVSDRPAESIDTFDITLSLTDEDIVKLEAGENVSYAITTTIRNFVTGELNGVYNEYEKANISSVDAIIIITSSVTESNDSNESNTNGTLMLEDATIDYVPGTTTYKVMLPLTCDVEATAVGIGILTSEEVVSLSRQSDGTLQYSEGLYCGIRMRVQVDGKVEK